MFCIITYSSSRFLNALFPRINNHAPLCCFDASVFMLHCPVSTVVSSPPRVFRMTRKKRVELWCIFTENKHINMFVFRKRISGSQELSSGGVRWWWRAETKERMLYDAFLCRLTRWPVKQRQENADPALQRHGSPRRSRPSLRLPRSSRLLRTRPRASSSHEN